MSCRHLVCLETENESIDDSAVDSDDPFSGLVGSGLAYMDVEEKDPSILDAAELGHHACVEGADNCRS